MCETQKLFLEFSERHKEYFRSFELCANWCESRFSGFKFISFLCLNRNWVGNKQGHIHLACHEHQRSWNIPQKGLPGTHMLSGYAHSQGGQWRVVHPTGRVNLFRKGDICCFFQQKAQIEGIIFYFFFHFYNVFVVHFLILLPSSFSESLSKLSCARNNSVLCCWTRVLNLEPYFPLEPTRSCIIFVWFRRSLFCSCLRVIFWIFSNFQWFISQKGEFQGQQCYSACIL